MEIWIPNNEAFRAINVDEAITKIAAYLEDTSDYQFIYFDGWGGLGASAVLKSLAEHPPPSLRIKTDSIIHIDCSKWKNRRTLQRTIAQALKLPQHVMDILDRQDDDDDFGGVDEGSRGEIREVGRVIHQAMLGQTFLVVFHNGSNRIIDLNDFGIPRNAVDPWSDAVGGKVLWTFRGRFRWKYPYGLEQRSEYLNLEQVKIEDKSSTMLFSYFSGDVQSEYYDEILLEEAREIAQYTNKPSVSVTPEQAATCCRYLLSLNSSYRDTHYFDWATHASNYWVCDGIIQDSQQDNAWDIAAALQEEMLIEEERGGPNNRMNFPYFIDRRRWIVAGNARKLVHVLTIKPEETTSLFLLDDKLPGDFYQRFFQRFEQLHVLKLSSCVFMFSSPPFLHCKTIRFLGLDSCMDESEGTEEEDEQQDRWIIEFFQSLSVLDIFRTDWEVTSSPDITKEMETNIREINIKEGRIWHKKLGWTWRHLRNIHKLRLIAPTSPWETESSMDDDFTELVKLELLDLTGNSTIQVLPSLSGATALSTLVLDGCIELENVGPESLPPSLETFSLSVQGPGKKAKISRISMAACSSLVNFRLGGSLPNLEELDLSNTSVKILDLRDKVVQVPSLQQVILMGCKRLCAVLWPKEGMPKLMVLCIDTRNGGGETIKPKMSLDSLMGKQEEECRRSSVYATDIRFLQSLMAASGQGFCWKSTAMLNLMNICLSCTPTSNKEDMGPCSTGQLVGSTLHKPQIPKSYRTYSDVNFGKATVDHDGSIAQQFEPLELHLEIGGGILNSNVVSKQGIRALIFFMNNVDSLLLHDNSSISTIITKDMMSIEVDDNDDDELGRRRTKMTTKKKMVVDWSCLKWCRVIRCPGLDTVFATNNDISCFDELKTFWGHDLLMARCIWSKGRPINMKDRDSFAKLKTIHLHSCPRLTFVLPQSWLTLPSLETIWIIYCGNLSQVFPIEPELLMNLSTDRSQKGVLEFPKLKNIYLHDLPKLHQICEAKIFAPELQNIWVRGCWSLKRLPATSDRPHSCAVVDCEEDWWNNLEWDGKEAGHHPSLFEPRHSNYYKNTLLRSSVLR